MSDDVIALRNAALISYNQLSDLYAMLRDEGYLQSNADRPSRGGQPRKYSTGIGDDKAKDLAALILRRCIEARNLLNLKGKTTIPTGILECIYPEILYELDSLFRQTIKRCSSTPPPARMNVCSDCGSELRGNRVCYVCRSNRKREGLTLGQRRDRQCAECGNLFADSERRKVCPSCRWQRTKAARVSA